MEGERASQVRVDGGVVSPCEPSQNLNENSSDISHVEGDIGRSVNYGVHSNFLRDKSDLINDGDNIPGTSSLASHSCEQVENKISIGLRDDTVKLSQFSYARSRGSEREILLEPLSADCESASVSMPKVFSTKALLNEPVRETMLTDEVFSLTESAAGPSEEREDISDEELEPDSWAAEKLQEDNVGSTYIDSPSKALEATAETPLSSADTEDMPYDNDVQQSPLSDGRDIVDLKLEDAVGKSDLSSLEGNQQSKDHNEDLETVSDDELSEAALIADLPVDSAFKLIEGGEQVSSSEDECPDSTYAVLQQDLSQVDKISNKHNIEGSEFSYGAISSSGLTFKIDEVSTTQLSSEPPGMLSLPLAPMEAEPISDEEDLGHTDSNLLDVEDGEAGEIHSPADVGSPTSFPEQTSAGLLGEVEPISAEENSDTDGELPSGDEDTSKTENGGLNSNNFLESIDSEEEGDLGPDLSHKQLSSHSRRSPVVAPVSFPKQNAGEYMETISDEDDSLSVGGNAPKRSSESTLKAFDESHSGTSPASKDTEAEKRQTSANFNEHQEELDYEENEGDDGEGKSEETIKPHEKREVKETRERGEDRDSDKDEGELSDDDCEEGEIKEPGSKKPFVKPMCRFFQRGNCTWGINCRFLHPGINDKGNYQMIEIPGFKPVGIRARIGTPGTWPEQPEEQIELPPPPIPDVPPVETAWERGLRIAKEQRKKASERKEQESDFAEKCLNLSVDEDKELNKENERMPKIIPKDPYYDQHGLEEDNYYHLARNPWQTGHYENFEVRYNRENSFSPPYREKPPMLPPPRFSHPYSSPVDKFGRDRIDRREPFRPEVPPATHEYPPAIKRPDEWTDPWRRSKSPQNQKRKIRSRSRGRRTRRSVSDSSNSSRSSSGSSSGSSRSSRTFNSSTGSSSRSRSPEPVPPSVERHDRYISPSREQPRSAVSVRGSGGYNNYDQVHRRMGRGYDHNRGAHNYNQRGGGHRGGGGGGGGGGSFYNNYGGMGAGPAGGYPEREMRDRPRDDRVGRNRARSPPDRPLPYVRPRPKSISSRSSTSRSRSRSRGRATSSRSRSRSSSGSSRSSSSSSSSAGSADSEHLYRDLGSPSKNPRGPSAPKRKRTNSHKDHSSGKSPQLPGQPASQRRQGPTSQLPVNLDHIPHPRDPKPPLPPPSSGRPESKYASRNAPQVPVKAKDPLKVVGQKSNIKLTLLPKQQQSSLGSRHNPLDSPPHNKRRLSEHDTSPVQAPPAKRLTLPMSQTSALRIAIEKAAKIQIRQEKGKSPPPALIPQSLPPSSSLSSNAPFARAAVSPQKAPVSIKSRATEQVVPKAVPKPPPTNIQPAAPAAGTKAKKSMSSRREELLKQLKAVEDAIARKKSKIQ